MGGGKGDALESGQDDLDDVGGGFGVDSGEAAKGAGGDDGDGGVDHGAGQDIGMHGLGPLGFGLAAASLVVVVVESGLRTRRAGAAFEGQGRDGGQDPPARHAGTRHLAGREVGVHGAVEEGWADGVGLEDRATAAPCGFDKAGGARLVVEMAEFDILTEQGQDGKQRGHGGAVLHFGQELIALVPAGTRTTVVVVVIVVVLQGVVPAGVHEAPVPAWMSFLHGLDKDLHEAIDHQAEALFLLEQQGLAGNELAGLHGAGEFVEDGALEVAKDLDGTEELVEVVGQAWLGVAILGIGEEIDVWFLALGLGGEAGIDVQKAVADKPADGRDQQQGDDETAPPFPVSPSRHCGHSQVSGHTYRVVKFMVKVRLMEKRVKRAVGTVMVVKVMSQ